MRKLEVAETRMYGRTFLDRVPNEVFLVGLGVADKLREGRLQWFGHVHRRPMTAPMRKVDSVTVEGQTKEDIG